MILPMSIFSIILRLRAHFDNNGLVSEGSQPPTQSVLTLSQVRRSKTQCTTPVHQSLPKHII